MTMSLAEPNARPGTPAPLGAAVGQHGRVAVIIPAFNEAATIGSVVLSARPHAHHLLVVDDGSSDATAAIAEAGGAMVIRRAANGGKGAALRAGIRAALDAGAAVVVTLDADGQHDPGDIPRLLGAVRDGADVAIGSRRLDQDQRARTPLARRMGHRLFGEAVRVAGGGGATDSESGFRAYRAALLQRLPITEEGYGVDWTLLAHARRAGAAIVDVPIAAEYRVPKPSKHGTARLGWEVSRGIVRFVRSQHPLAFFGVPGALLLAAGIVLGAQTAQGYYAHGQFWVGKAILAALCLSLGAVALVAAVVLDTLQLMLRKLDAGSLGR